MEELDTLRRIRNTLVIKVRYWKKEMETGRHDDPTAIEKWLCYDCQLLDVRDRIHSLKEELKAAKKQPAVIEEVISPEWKPLMWVHFE
jgi:hypothetical protein